MNQSPWQVENAARYERERIQGEMAHIRLEQQALEGRVKRPDLISRVWSLTRQWLAARKDSPNRMSDRPALKEMASKSQTTI
jgi:hypothetical protein